MKQKIIETLMSETFNTSDEAGNSYIVTSSEDFDDIAERIVKLFDIPVVMYRQMSVSIMEALQNADYNLDNAMKMPMLLPMVKEQLHNATVLLDKGYNIWTEVEPLLEKWGSVEDVPELDDNDDIDQDD